jgi:hypothetical protein
MSRLSWLLLLLLPCAVAAEPRLALTRESEPAFTELMHQAQQGAFGPDVDNLNATILKDRVQIELKERGGGVRTLWLWPTTMEEKQTLGMFRVEPASRAAPTDGDQLRRLLTQIFRSDPFLVENDGMDGRRVNPMGGPPPGSSGPALAVAGPRSRRATVLLATVQFSLLILALAALWRAALRQRRE